MPKASTKATIHKLAKAILSPIHKPMIKEPVPEQSHLIKTISKGSELLIIRVQLFSKPQQIAAPITKREP